MNIEMVVRAKEVAETVLMLRDRWPLTFCWPPQPLKVGIFEDIQIEIGTDPWLLSPALNYWVKQPAYLLQCAWPGTPRFGLDGRIAGVVTEIDASYARRQMVRALGWAAPGETR